MCVRVYAHLHADRQTRSYPLEHVVLGKCEIEPGVLNLNRGQKSIFCSTAIQLLMVMAGDPSRLTWQWHYGCSVGILKDNLTMRKPSRITKMQQSSWVAKLLTVKKPQCLR